MKRDLPLGRRCKRCWDQGWPEDFDSEPKCAFSTGEFSPENWCCATAIRLREFMQADGAEAFSVRRDDSSFGALWVPSSVRDVPDGEEVGPWRGGGLIAATWYKDRGTTDILIRVDARDGGIWSGASLPLLLDEAEAALRNLEEAQS